jgi:hypothetical protein
MHNGISPLVFDANLFEWGLCIGHIIFAAENEKAEFDICFQSSG